MVLETTKTDAPPGSGGEEGGAPEPLRRRIPVAVRMAIFYAAIFAPLGVSVPYWPVWLAHKGLGPEKIGAIVAAALVLRVWANPVIGRIADRQGARRRILIALSWGGFLATSLYLLVDGFVGILAVALLVSLLVPPQISLTENTGVLASYQRGYDYGRVRLWGSAAFVGGTLLAGLALGLYGAGIVIWLVIAGMAATAVLSWLLPDVRSPPATEARGAVRRFLAEPRFLLFLAASSLVNASHGVFYTFGALHWGKAGIDPFWVSVLWSVGVVAEIALFAWSDKVVRLIGPARLLLFAALGGMVRWVATAASDALPVLFVAQLLHALTFGFCHLGAMHFLARAAPADLGATAQGLYSAIGTGLVVALVTALAGPLYAHFGGGAYFAMAGACAFGALAAWALVVRWKGGVLKI